MRQRGWIFLLTAMLLSAATVSAAGTGGLSFSAAVVPIWDGSAGSGPDGPTYSYSDAFNTGWGVRVEPFYDFTPMIRGQFGVAYNTWGGGQTFSGIVFDDLKIMTCYIGMKVRFRPNSNIRPYVVADLGAARLSSVNVSGPGGSISYWGSSTTGFVDVGGGVEFKVAPKVTFFIDIRHQGTGKPDSKSPPFSDAGNMISLPVSVGVNIAF